MIRVCIDYNDAARTREQWANAYLDREIAFKFLATMRETYAGSISVAWVEVWCETHGEWELEDEGVCVQCAFPCCRDVLADYNGDLLCPECTQDRDTGWTVPRREGAPADGPI